jgi:hypothetical protein
MRLIDRFSIFLDQWREVEEMPPLKTSLIGSIGRHGTVKTTSPVVNGRPRSSTRRASLVAICLAAAVLAFSQSVFAQTQYGFAPARSIEHHGISMTSDLDDPWDATPPSLVDPALAPAPKEPVEPPLTQMDVPFTPRVDRGPIELWDDPAIPYTQPMAVSRPNSMGMPGGGLPYPLR